MTARNDRRRRLLTDDRAGVDDDSETQLRIAEGSSRDGAYSAAARSDRQPRVQDLFPSRYLTISLIALAGLAAVGILSAFHVFTPALAELLSAEEVVALSLSSDRNLSHWFASLVLGQAGLTALFIYSLRRHRNDDYHGRYRVWILMAAACLVGSLIETTDVSRMARALCRRTAEISNVTEDIVWPPVVVSLVGVLGVRLLFEVRRCRLAALVLFLAALGLVTTATVHWNWISETPEEFRPLILRGSWLLSYVFVLATFLLYSRHVLLEIEGRAAVRPATKKAKKPSAPKSGKSSLHVRTDLDPVEKVPPPHTQTRANHERKAEAADDEPAEEAQTLSRAERRKLRRDAKMAS